MRQTTVVTLFLVLLVVALVHCTRGTPQKICSSSELVNDYLQREVCKGDAKKNPDVCTKGLVPVLAPSKGDLVVIAPTKQVGVTVSHYTYGVVDSLIPKINGNGEVFVKYLSSSPMPKLRVHQCMNGFWFYVPIDRSRMQFYTSKTQSK